MSDLLWAGDERAGDVFDDKCVLEALIEAEDAWLQSLVDTGIAPQGVSLRDVVGPSDVTALADSAETDGNPVPGLVTLLRERTGSSWVHRGLTSQDTLDTALVLCLRPALDRVLADLENQGVALVHLVRAHRGSVMAGRTITQYAVPITFGLKSATWLSGIADAVIALRRTRGALAVQAGGAAGTLAAVVELARDHDDPVGTAATAVQSYARALDLPAGVPWHTNRTSLTNAADALVSVADTWGRIGADVALLSRPEIRELREGSPGGSSTMPNKANPVLSILLRRHALAAPGLAATLHTAAASYVDERPAGAWHAEWGTLRSLARRSVVAASQATDLLNGLVVNSDRMTSRAHEVSKSLTAEQRNMGDGEGTYLGATDLIIDMVLDRARLLWGEH